MSPVDENLQSQFWPWSKGINAFEVRHVMLLVMLFQLEGAFDTLDT